MRLLLDTHVAIWATTNSPRLPETIKAIIAAPEAAVFVSVVTVWEIAIKYPLKKRNAPPFPAAQAIGFFEQAGFPLLEVKARHAAAVETLPLLHGDPFDRLLVAQALTEPLRLVSHDRRVAAYSDTVITW